MSCYFETTHGPYTDFTKDMKKKKSGRRPNKNILGILKSFGLNGFRVYMQSDSLLYHVMELSETEPQVESIPSSLPLTESF